MPTIFLLVKNKKDPTKIHSFDLPHGSLLIMGGDTQINWLHCIKEEDTDNQRFNLTFRKS